MNYAIVVLMQLRVLSLSEATQTAQKNQPALRQANAQTEQARARVDEAAAGLLPSVTGSAIFSTGTNNGHTDFITGNEITNSFDLANTYNAGIAASILIWDFNQTSHKRDSAAALLDAAARGGDSTLLGVVLNVRIAYFAARANRGLVTVAKETLDNQQKHLEQIQKFVSVGTRPEIDLAQARTQVANARVQLIQAENAFETSKAQLNQAMGLEHATTEFDVGDETLPPVLGEDGGVDPLVDEAVKARPELATFQAQIRAQELLVKANEKALWPVLKASTGLVEAGGRLDDMNWNWSAAITLTWPIYDGGFSPARTRESEWGVRALQAQLDSERQEVHFEVEQARLAVRGAKAALEASEEALVNAKEQLRLAEGRYAAGVGNVIELGDAQVALTGAAAQRVQADFNLASARAQLLKAIGRVS
jgi:outer membrane protein